MEKFHSLHIHETSNLGNVDPNQGKTFCRILSFAILPMAAIK
jgi:hypothetical protein